MMKFTIKREAVVETSCNFELDNKSLKELINLLLSNYDVDLSDVSTPAEFFKTIQQDGLESVVFDLIVNYLAHHQMHDTYRDGEEYYVYLV